MVVKEFIDIIESKPDHTKDVVIQDEDGQVIKCIYCAFNGRNLIFVGRNSDIIRNETKSIKIDSALREININGKYLSEYENYSIIIFTKPNTYGFENFDIIFDINGNLNFVVK